MERKIMNDEQKGILFTILTSLSLALNVIFGKLLVDSINVETGNTIWFMSASILYVIFFIFARKTKNFKIIWERKKEILLIGILSSIGSILWMYGIFYAGTNNMSFVFQFNIIFTVLLGVTFLGDRFKKLEIIGVLVSIAGIIILAYDNSGISILGIAIILFSAVFNSLTNFVSKIFVSKINPIVMSGGRAISMFLIVLVYTLATNKLQTNIPNATLTYAFLGGLSGAFIGFMLFYKALEKIKISKVMTIRTIEPFLVVIFSFVILLTIPTINQLAGGSFIVIGIIIIVLTNGR
jgi:drug/metabolite transporter (DMT)-like permease